MTARVLFLAALLLALLSGSAQAGDARAEAAAKDALQRAPIDYATGAYDHAIAWLGRASAACGKCAPETRAALLRDAGVMRARKGDENGAIADFVFALKLAQDLAMPAAYDDPAVLAAWKKARERTLGVAPTVEQQFGQPTGDFIHKPWAEQRANTPLPLYVEYDGHLTRVVVAYQAEGDTEWKRIRLRRVGKGWGGAIGCADVKLGTTIVYFIQGLDGEDTVATSGDKRHVFRTEIRESIEGITPHLPGRPAPHGCDLQKGCEVEPYACGANEPGDQESGAPFSRIWLGIAGSVGFAAFGGGNNVCHLNSAGVASSGWYCTNPDGTDFPSRKGSAENDSIVQGRGGTVDAGASVAVVRVLAAIDYAATDNLLVGARIGVVAGVYPGKIGASVGIPLHLEGRAAWVFGDQPLARTGFEPEVMFGLGTTRIDSNADVAVQRNTIAGARTMTAWQVGGPFFLGAGGGVRYAFSPRVAMTILARFDASLGGPVVVPALGLEGTLQWGF